eukprot:284818045_3
MMKQESVQRVCESGVQCFARAVYIVPYDACVKARAAEWSHRFGKLLNLKVAELTGTALDCLSVFSGDVSTDLKLITDSNLIVSSPERWDFVSRRWRTRRVLQQIRLFIVDELELLDSPVRYIIAIFESSPGGSHNGSLSEPHALHLRSAPAPGQIYWVVSASFQRQRRGELAGRRTRGAVQFPKCPQPQDLCRGLRHSPSAFATPVYGPSDIPVDKEMLRRVSVCNDILFGQKANSNHCGEFVVPGRSGRQADVPAYIRGGDGRSHQGSDREIATEHASLWRRISPRVHTTNYKHCHPVVRFKSHSGACFNAISVEYQVQRAPRHCPGHQICQVKEVRLFLSGTSPARWINYPIVDVMRMMGRAGSAEDAQVPAAFLIMCPQSRRNFYNKFKSEPLPVESCLDQVNICSPIVSHNDFIMKELPAIHTVLVPGGSPQCSCVEDHRIKAGRGRLDDLVALLSPSH